MLSRYLLLGGAFVTLASCQCGVDDELTTTATIDVGTVIGTATNVPSATAPVVKYLGIPFAETPPKRFLPPQPVKPFTEPLNATQWAHACIQQFDYPEPARSFTIGFLGGNPPPNESEDCLYLNVYAPSGGSGDKAVLFWIYGGGLAFGNAGQTAYDGSFFAAFQDVVVVAPNYRVSAFGFSNSPDIPITHRNVGFLDQRLALDWVQRNIASFGGDPKKVTIFGESAGASSVDRLVTTFANNPPFRAAITQSGQASVSARPSNNGTEAWLQLVDGLNCTTARCQLSCVQAADAFEIKNITELQALNFSPATDNVTQRATPLPTNRNDSSQFATVPILTGTNGQEGRVFLLNQISNDSNALSDFIEGAFPNSTDLQQQVTDAYPIGQAGLVNPFDVAAQIYTEYYFQCPSALVARFSADANIPTWRYYYNATFPNFQAPGGLGLPNLRAYHASEIPIVFGTYEKATEASDGDIPEQEIELSKSLQKAWADFAKDPQSGPGWEALGSTGNVGCLGCNGSTGVQVIPQSDIDFRCNLYEEIYTRVTTPAFKRM